MEDLVDPKLEAVAVSGKIERIPSETEITSLIGKIAAGAIARVPEDFLGELYELGEIIRADYPLDSFASQSQELWTQESALRAGKWLSSIVAKKKNPKERTLNENIISRAAQLGFMPDPEEIETLFGNTLNFYQDMELEDAERRFQWLTPERAKIYIIDFIDQNGYFPTYEELDELAQDRKNPPSYVLRWRLSPGGIKKLGKDLGLIRERWSPKECVDLQVDFMLANAGLMASQEDINLLSRQEKGPAYRTIYGIMDRKSFEDRSRQQFKQEVKQRNKVDRAILVRLNSGRLPAAFPREILYGVGEKNTAVLIYSRYLIVRKMLGDVPGELLTRLINPETSGQKFMLWLQREKPDTTMANVDKAIEELGLYRNIWRGQAYYDSLQIENVVARALEEKRGTLNEKGKEEYEEGIKAGAAVLGRFPLRMPAVQRFLPDMGKFTFLYGGIYMFNRLIRAYSIRERQRQEAQPVWLLDNLHTQHIGGVAVQDERDDSDDLKVIVLEPAGSKVVEPGSPEAKRILKRVRVFEDAKTASAYTIQASNGVRRKSILGGDFDSEHDSLVKLG